MAEQTPVKNPTNRLWVWLAAGLIVIIAAAVVYYLTIYQTNSNANSNLRVNSAANSNQTALTNADETLTTDTNAAIMETAKTRYHNNAFGYTVQYYPNSSVAASTLRSTWDIQNPAENLYSEWGLSEADNTVIAISVYPIEKRDEVFTNKKYSIIDDTEKLNDEVTANYLKVDGVVHGYYFIQANYIFILSTSFTVGVAGYEEFKTIAQSLTFTIQPE